MPDEFYEFGVEDYAKVVQGYKIAKQRAEAGLRTAKMRETEAVERAKRFPETRIRIFFPDGFIVQVTQQVSLLSTERAFSPDSG